MNHSLTVSEIIDNAPLSRYQITTVLLCGLVLVLDGFDTQSIGFLAPAMAESLRVPVKTFGPVFAAALVGLMISSMTAGPIADRLGRKWPIVASTLIFATFALITTSATSLNQLMAYRFLTGLGLGGAMPNVVALTSEYAPKKARADFGDDALLRDAFRCVSWRNCQRGDIAYMGLAGRFLRRGHAATRGGAGSD